MIIHWKYNRTFWKSRTPLTEDKKAIFYSDVFLKKNSDKKLVKICEANKCHDGVWCEGKDYCSYHERCLSKLREYYSNIKTFKNKKFQQKKLAE